MKFKVCVPSKVRELTEDICAFANADGGYLLIRVDDNGQVVDTNLENDKRSVLSVKYLLHSTLWLGWKVNSNMTRNPLIFGLFTRMHLVERTSSGIPRMQEAMKDANLSEP